MPLLALGTPDNAISSPTRRSECLTSPSYTISFVHTAPPNLCLARAGRDDWLTLGASSSCGRSQLIESTEVKNKRRLKNFRRLLRDQELFERFCVVQRHSDLQAYPISHPTLSTAQHLSHIVTVFCGAEWRSPALDGHV